jgi:hypothetical protein
MVWDQLTTGETEKINKALPVVIYYAQQNNTVHTSPYLPTET